MESLTWEKFDVATVVRTLRTDQERGLSDTEIAKRQKRYGKNVFEEVRDITLLGKIFRQFKSPLISILLVAGFFTIVLAEYVDTIVIFVALLINVVVGVFQEERASHAFEKLNQSQERHATVIRNGRKHLILAEELVPGDIVEIEGGQYVPADIRLMSGKSLFINEAMLTGEWVAVPKDTEPLSSDVAISERRNMVWRGTLVAEGYGTGIVVETGAQTQVGIIARELSTIEEHITPLQQNIRFVARFLTYIIAGAILVIFALGIFRGEPLSEMILISVAIAVATIPSGLPAAVTVVLALGMEKILKRGGLVRNLLAAETLGATTIILTDKTGTLTEAKMSLANIYTLDTIRREDNQKKDGWSHDEKEVLKGAVLASDAFVEEQIENATDGSPQELIVRGRPIEKAVVIAGLDAGISQHDLHELYKPVDYLQFESTRRFGAALTKGSKPHANLLFIAGAPETLFACSPFVYKNGRRQKLTIPIQEDFIRMQIKRSEEGMRFIGVAYKEVSWDKIPEKEAHVQSMESLLQGSTFLGFLAFEDPIRTDVKEAMIEVRQAGIEVKIVTGDNPDTARKVACDVGIACEKKDIKLGRDIDACESDDELYALIKKTKVFARTLPNQKVRIARVLKNKKEIVAMTGDGVNDAPALRSANIGVAVGSGTEVAKEASDIILLNNSFSIIVAAIEEGRRIMDNLRKIIAYLLSTSFSEVFIIGGALVFGAPLPLLPAQILWANIIEEGLMSFSFAFERKSPHIMRRNPRESSSRTILTPPLQRLIILVSTVTGIFLVSIFFTLQYIGVPLEEIRTIMFVALSLDAIFFTFSLKSLEQPLWRINIFSNRYLLVAFSVSLLLLLSAILFAPLRTLLSLVPLTLLDALFLLGVGLFNLFTIEVAKFFLFEQKGRK
ncbi:MAG TPA: HAD-IC family P-type ATPase [Candidatus Paceibacterota bacterium]